MNCIDHHSNRCHTYKRIEKLTGLPDQQISLQRDPMQTIRDQQASGRVEICNSISGALISALEEVGAEGSMVGAKSQLGRM